MPTTNDDDIELTEYADESGSTGDGSETYLLMELEGSNSVKSGYIRLGGVDPTIKAQYAKLVAGQSVDWTDDQKTKGEDLASEVLTFVDDGRIRGPADESGGSTEAADNAFRTLSQAERKAETDTLHTTGGWRDHTEGNRITTTRGDKIEVIRGNFKQRVLGRSQWNDDAGSGLHWESSGGITYHYDEVPGQIVDVRWSDDDGTWRVFEECDTGHQVERYHGVMKEWSRGGDVVERVGSMSAYDDDNDTKTAFWADWFGWGNGPDGFDADDDFDKPSDASHLASVTWPSSDALPNVSEEIYADEVYGKTICNEFVARTGSFTRPVTKITESSHTEDLVDQADYETYLNFSIGGVAIEYWKTWFFEDFNGENVSVKAAGLFGDVRAGYAFSEIDFAVAKVNVKLAKAIADVEAAIVWSDISLSLLTLDLDFSTTKQTHHVIYHKMQANKFQLGLALFLG